MKIGVIGCGALGSFYGAKLCRDGHDVHFLLRSDFETVQKSGVSVRSPDGDFHVRPRCAIRSDRIGPCDLVLIGLKTTANDQFPALLPPMVGRHTAVISLQNGLGNEEALAALFPIKQILGGLCFVCLNRLEPGVIQHIAHGRIVLGEFRRSPYARTEQIAAAFRNAGVPCTISDNLERAHWEKLVWNIPFNGLGVASAAGYEATVTGTVGPGIRQECLTTDKLLSDHRWESLVRDLMLEVIHAANAQGLLIPESLAEKQIERTRTMGAYKASTLIDYERGQPLEFQSMFMEPLCRATRAGVKMPRLAAMCEVLQRLDRGARAFEL